MPPVAAKAEFPPRLVLRSIEADALAPAVRVTAPVAPAVAMPRIMVSPLTTLVYSPHWERSRFQRQPWAGEILAANIGRFGCVLYSMLQNSGFLDAMVREDYAASGLEICVSSSLARRGKLAPQLAQQVGSQFSNRIEGTCVKHRSGKASIKIYDKAGIVLLIETTANDVSFFKHHRKVERRDGPPARELAPVKKSIYSLIDLREIILGCNQQFRMSNVWFLVVVFPRGKRIGTWPVYDPSGRPRSSRANGPTSRTRRKP